jgi:hypothetical protein
MSFKSEQILNPLGFVKARNFPNFEIIEANEFSFPNCKALIFAGLTS